MLMSHHVGIDRKKGLKEQTRRLDAKENEIILEKETGPKMRAMKKEQGVGALVVGRFSGGTLKFAKNDVDPFKGLVEAGLAKERREGGEDVEEHSEKGA
jgi:hypothetical protein